MTKPVKNISDIRLALQDALTAPDALSDLAERFPPKGFDSIEFDDDTPLHVIAKAMEARWVDWTWVDLPSPRTPLVAILERFLEEHPDCRWTSRHYTQIGFADPTHAVMFKLMLP